jgi:hypothetical protein
MTLLNELLIKLKRYLKNVRREAQAHEHLHKSVGRIITLQNTSLGLFIVRYDKNSSDIAVLLTHCFSAQLLPLMKHLSLRATIFCIPYQHQSVYYVIYYHIATFPLRGALQTFEVLDFASSL